MKKPKKFHRKRRSVSIRDVTQEIARHKATSRVHGPFMVTCQACGGRYMPDHEEHHLKKCRPPEIHLNGTRIKPQTPMVANPSSSINTRTYSDGPPPQRTQEEALQLLRRYSVAGLVARARAIKSGHKANRQRRAERHSTKRNLPPAVRILFGSEWSYAEFKHENLKVGIQVKRADYSRCKRGMKKPSVIQKSVTYSKAHGTLIDLAPS